MKKLSFFNRTSTAIVALYKPATLNDLIVMSRNAEFDGADGLAPELCNLPLELRTRENFERIMREVRLPFMFVSYRNDRFLGKDDEARQKYLLEAAAAGAEVIDVMGDLFEPSPYELAVSPEAISKQRRLIDQIHELGAKVVMSSHMPQARSGEEVLKHLRRQSERGADILKIVTGVNSEAELTEAVRTTMLLHRELDKPFVHLSNGSFSRPQRYFSMLLGGAICFAVHEYESENIFSMPTIKSMLTVRDTIPWHIDQYVEHHTV